VISVFLSRQIDESIKKVKGQIANIITLANLSLGCLAILYIVREQAELSLLMIFLAAFFDRFDGALARKLETTSEFGKQIDSLSDLISFGIAPAILLYQGVLHEFGVAGTWITIIFILCSAIRLARFNVTTFSGYFVGLPITAAGCIMTLSFLIINYMPLQVFMFLTLILSLLMISNIKVKKA
jgi:CDP-diacylglycerol--serine O-phosphatidyltransferase